MASGQNSGDLTGSENVGGVNISVEADIKPLTQGLEEAKAVATSTAEDINNTLHLNAEFDANAIKASLEKEIESASKNAELNLNLDDYVFKGFEDLPGKVEPVTRSIRQKLAGAFESLRGIRESIFRAIAPLGLLGAGAGVAAAAFASLRDAMEAAQRRADYFKNSVNTFRQIAESLNQIGDVGLGSVSELRAELKRLNDESQKQEDDLFKKRKDGFLTVEQLNQRVSELRDINEKKTAELRIAIDAAIEARIGQQRAKSDSDYLESQRQLANKIAEFARQTNDAELEGIEKARSEKIHAIQEAEDLRSQTADKAQRDELDKAIESIKRQYEAKVEGILDAQREERLARATSDREARESAQRQADAFAKSFAEAFASIRDKQIGGFDQITSQVQRIADIVDRMERSRR